MYANWISFSCDIVGSTWLRTLRKLDDSTLFRAPHAIGGIKWPALPPSLQSDSALKTQHPTQHRASFGQKICLALVINYRSDFPPLPPACAFVPEETTPSGSCSLPPAAMAHHGIGHGTAHRC